MLVGVVARAHGNRGEVIVNPESDFVEERFRPDRRLFAKMRDGRTSALTIATVRFHKERPVVRFAGIDTMNDAEALAGAELKVLESEIAVLPDRLFYRHELVGCEVETKDGRAVGRVTAVEGPIGGSRLVVERAGAEILIPLVDEICVSIDTIGRRILVDPPEGLLELK
ncbi:MAG: 16S rRNA processing protein RimM [Acidobacteria bacterium]|nr:16S rRNA processing protein RimM [Acidobacteriota bacterium]MBI3264723.1 16S rRNA processing protein RimM [Acidobacteriota bacterium]